MRDTKKKKKMRGTGQGMKHEKIDEREMPETLSYQV